MDSDTISISDNESIILNNPPTSEDEVYPWVVKNLKIMKRSLKMILENDYLECDGTLEDWTAHELVRNFKTIPECMEWAEEILNMDCEEEARILLCSDESDSNNESDLDSDYDLGENL